MKLITAISYFVLIFDVDLESVVDLFEEFFLANLKRMSRCSLAFLSINGNMVRLPTSQIEAEAIRMKYRQYRRNCDIQDTDESFISPSARRIILSTPNATQLVKELETKRIGSTSGIKEPMYLGVDYQLECIEVKYRFTNADSQALISAKAETLDGEMLSQCYGKKEYMTDVVMHETLKDADHDNYIWYLSK
ncbi:hypothetical protein Tco_0242751 [Tanacetum coccineum]